MVAETSVRSGYRSLLLRVLTVGVLIGACVVSVPQTHAQNSAKDYCDRGNSLVHKRKYDEAIAAYDQAIKINPNYAAAYNMRGSVWKRKHEYDKAIADYDQAIKNDPNRYGLLQSWLHIEHEEGVRQGHR